MSLFHDGEKLTPLGVPQAASHSSTNRAATLRDFSDQMRYDVFNMVQPRANIIFR